MPSHHKNVEPKSIPIHYLKQQKNRPSSQHSMLVVLVRYTFKLNYGAEDRTCTYISFREGKYSEIEILPHNKYGAENRTYTCTSFREGKCSRIKLFPHA